MLAPNTVSKYVLVLLTLLVNTVSTNTLLVVLTKLLELKYIRT